MAWKSSALATLRVLCCEGLSCPSKQRDVILTWLVGACYAPLQRASAMQATALVGFWHHKTCWLGAIRLPSPRHLIQH